MKVQQRCPYCDVGYCPHCGDTGYIDVAPPLCPACGGPRRWERVGAGVEAVCACGRRGAFDNLRVVEVTA